MSTTMRKRNFIQLFFGMIIIAGIVSCDVDRVTDAAKDFRLIIELEPIETTPTVLITDATTGELIQRNVRVTFAGKNGKDVIDTYSDPLNEKNIQDGILNFGIQNSVPPSEDSPVIVQLILESNQYVRTAKTIKIREDGSTDYQVKMLKKNVREEKKGIYVTINNEGFAEKNGRIKNRYAVETYSNAKQSAGTTLQILNGSVFKDENGNILTGPLRTELTFYDPSVTEALELSPVDLINSDGKTIYAAGINTISISDQNNHVAISSILTDSEKSESSEKISLSLAIPNDFQNPIDGNPFKAGDPLVVTSFDQNLQILDEETVKIEKLSKGRNGVIFDSMTLPYAVVIGSVIDESVTCSANIVVNRNGNTGKLFGTASGAGFFNEIHISNNNNRFEFEAPNTDLTVKIETATDSKSVQVNFCDQPEVSIQLPAPPPKLIDASVHVKLACVNADKVISITNLPGASITYRKSSAKNGTKWRLAKNLKWNYDHSKQALTGATFDINAVEKDEEYTFKLSFQENTYQKNAVITGPSVTYEEEIDEAVCL